MRAISFNGLDLQSGGIATVEMAWESSPLNVQVENNAHGNARVIDARTVKRDVQVRLTLSAADANALDALIDSVKQSLVGVEDNLSVSYNGTTRVYPAVCVSLSPVRKPQDITLVEVVAHFVVLGYGRAQSKTTQSYTGKTAALSETIAVTGTAPPAPKITVTINSVTNGTAIAITVGSDTITLTRTLAASDVIVVDADTLEVTVNGTTVDYDGIIPAWTTGNNTLGITITADAVNYDASVEYYPLYL